MFTLLGTVKADSCNRLYPLDEKHGVLIFVIADDLTQAQEKAEKKIRLLDWKELIIEKSGEMFSMPSSQQDETLKEAFSTAQKKGFAIIIYEDPIDN